jgi:spermidine/putrescine transport system substrate-binding protein
MTDPRKIDPALLRGLTQPRYSRRQFLRYAGAGAGSLSLAAVLAACGTKGITAASPSNSNSATSEGSPAWWKQQTQNDTLNFANWPAYIDVSHGKHPTIEKFIKDTGIKVNYTDPIDDNVTFFAAKVRPPLLANQYIGYDVIVLTNNDSPLGQMMEFGWLVPLDQTRMPNFYANASDLVKDPSWDPGNKYTMAWQSGYTCIGYNTNHIKEPITSVQSLFDPKYKGKIGMMGIASELGSFGLLAIGKTPATSTPADWTAAAAKLEEQKPLVRSYYDQSYKAALESEDIWISMAWSGDIFQSSQYEGHPFLKAVIPTEGAMFWTDNMCMPIHVQNPVDAMTYMDSVYDPHVQALIEDYNAYVCPVPAAQDIILHDLKDPTVANSPTVFPDAHQVSLSRPYYAWKNAAELKQWNDTFQPIFQA